MQPPECLPGELSTGRDKCIVRFGELLDKGRGIGFLLGNGLEEFGRYASTFELPAEEGGEFFAAS